jgi:cobalt-zinc-cadmium resistance protein CzcA
VRYVPEYRSSIEAIANMTVTSPFGARVPMSQLASIQLVDGPTIIQREDGKRQISVRTNIHGRDQGSFVREAQKKVDAVLHLKKGYSIEWGGQFENLSRAGKRLAVVVPITLVIIFTLLFALYRNFKNIFTAMANIPFSVVGGIIALLIRGYHFNVSAGVGFISLFGISIMSGVLFVSRTNKLRLDQGKQLLEAVREAAVIQLRPNLMTMLLALLGLIPAAMASGIGSDVQRPLATVIVGGLITTLLLTLMALPPLYIVIERLFAKKEELLTVKE